MVSNHALELANIDREIQSLQGVGRFITPEFEAAYEALVAQGLIKPVTR
jgi:hypothetical protein